MTEIFKDIEGYEGLYQVSNLGRVKSLKFNHTDKVAIMKPELIRSGYLRISLNKDGNQRHFLIHRLVADAFISNEDCKPCVDHINAVRTDNRAENLRWTTYSENCNNPITSERYSKAFTNGKLSKAVKQFSKDGEYIGEFPSTCEAERRLGIRQSNISACCRGLRKIAGGFIWKWA